jgi:hypothetical protein
MSIYIFGYGSLINMKENRELNSKKRRIICPVMVDGLKRAFNVSSSKYKVLGVKDTKNPNNQCNGILIKIDYAEELAKLLQREVNYTSKELDLARITFPYNKKLSFQPGDKVLCFYPKAKFTLTQKTSNQLNIRPNYLNICLNGAANFGKDFLQDFLDTTVE